MSTYLPLLKQRPHYRALWLAQVISLLGDWFNTVAVVALISQYTDSGMAVGALFLARSLPPFLLGPLAGVVADRFDRRWVMITSDLLRAVIVLGFLFVDRPGEAWLLYALTLVQFSVSAFFEPAHAAILPGLVRPDELVPANTLISITWSAMLTIGAAIGGITAAVFGTQTALVIDSLSFLASAAILLMIRGEPQIAHKEIIAPGWRAIGDGVGFLAQTPMLALVALVKGLGQVGSVDVMSALVAERVFPLGDQSSLSFGLLLAAHGLGAVLGPLLANLWGGDEPASLRRSILVGFGMISLSWLCLGLAPAYPVALAALVLRGMGGSINWTYSSILLQIEVPDHYLGRVFALDFAFFTLALSFSTWLTGFLVDQFALAVPTLALVIAASCLPSLLLWGLLGVRKGHRGLVN